MRTPIALAAALALALPAASMAAVNIVPTGGGPHTTYTVTADVPQAALPSGFGGPELIYDATVTPMRLVCGAARTVRAAETGSSIDAGQTLHFALRAPHHGWCPGPYRVVVHERVIVPPPADSHAKHAQTTTTVLDRTSFRVR
jgi:hypothetical protein